MEKHLVARPPKTSFPIDEQIRLRDLAIDGIKELLLPDEGIWKILLIGSSVKGSFGQYQPPGFRGSLYSDFDFIVYVRDGYVIPSMLKHEPDGKPFSNDKLNLAYRYPRFVENMYDAEIFFIRNSSLSSAPIREEGEQAGIPMSGGSKNPCVIVFEK